MNQNDIARQLLDLGRNYDRENITLLEDQPIDVTSPWNSYSLSNTTMINNDISTKTKSLFVSDVHEIDDDNALVEDEASVMLDRLKDLTTKALYLQVRNAFTLPTLSLPYLSINSLSLS